MSRFIYRLKVAKVTLCLLVIGFVPLNAAPLISPGVIGTVVDTGTTQFSDGVITGTAFAIEAITPASADKTLRGFQNRDTNKCWNVLPVDNSNPINPATPTRIVWNFFPEPLD